MRAVPSSYDEAQVCLNGHVTNSSIHETPEDNQTFCLQCGAKTIMLCQACQKSIRGFRFGSAFVPYTAPLYCHHCGAEFPWLTARLEAAKEIAATVAALSDEDRATLDQSIRDMAGDTPKATTGALKFKGLMTKAGREAAGLIRGVVTDVLSETAKKILLP